MPGNFLELPGIPGRRRGDLNPIISSRLVNVFALQIKGSRPIDAGLLKPQKPLHWGLFECESPQWGDGFHPHDAKPRLTTHNREVGRSSLPTATLPKAPRSARSRGFSVYRWGVGTSPKVAKYSRSFSL
jgi:hypothetical protein